MALEILTSQPLVGCRARNLKLSTVPACLQQVPQKFATHAGTGEAGNMPGWDEVERYSMPVEADDS